MISLAQASANYTKARHDYERELAKCRDDRSAAQTNRMLTAYDRKGKAWEMLKLAEGTKR